MAWLKCLETTENFPKAVKGKTYYGEADKNGDYHILDEYWLQRISINEFDIKKHGGYIKNANKDKFELVEE